MTEELYIFYRKLKALGNKLIFYMMRVFPIDKNLVSLCTFEGKGGFGCNPKYIAKQLHKKNPKYRFIWLVNDEAISKEFPDYIKKVNNTNIFSRAYWLSKSGVWIDNYRKPYGTSKRKNQLYINVNHYNVGIKATGLLRGKKFSKMAYLVSKNDSDMIDYLTIDSYWSESCFDKALVYDGEMLKIGSPRCDVLYGDRKKYKTQLIKKYNLQENSKILLYAPTFRETAKDGVRSVHLQTWTIDFERLIKVLEKKNDEKWYIFIKVHPQLANSFKGYKNPNLQNVVINVSDMDDIYELIAGVDSYITDYSSAVFEAGYARIPSFIYADDIKEYEHSRELMWEFTTDNKNEIYNNKKLTPKLDVKFPFSISQNNDELEKNIMDFDIIRYNKDMDEFEEKIGLIFDGKASERLCDFIVKKQENVI